MIRVVLIDDHKLVLDGLHALIGSVPDITVVNTFQNPKEALSYLDKNSTDVVFTDLDMPEMNGEGVLQYCKSKFPSTKIIVLSMHHEKTVIKHLIGLGADGYLTKSAGKEEIIQAIKTVESGSKYFADNVMQSLIIEENTVAVSDETLDQLTEREKEIIVLIANGLSSKEIGEELFISPRTAETHRNNILKKLDIQGIAGIVRFAFHHKLIQ
ncbi:MAG: response regulator [Bacteroidia bacterium]